MAYEKKEVVFDEDQWKVEAAAVIHDVKDHVKEIAASYILQGSDKEIYFNLTTLEGEKYCIQLSAGGFRVVSREYDISSLTDGSYFETPYSLLDSISQKFRESFGCALMTKLQDLQ